MTTRDTRGASLSPPLKSVIQELEDDISRIDQGIHILQKKKKLQNSWPLKPLKHILREPLHHGATLDRLHEERQLLSQALYSYTASYFILQRFPFEIWELIFSYSVPDISPHDTFNDLNRPSIREAPLSLSQVNRQWRTLAHNMPALWTRLKIQSSRHRGRMGFTLEAIKGWLSHTNQRPLTLSIAIVEERQKEANQCGLMEFIWSCSSRWQHLRLDLDSPEAMHLTLNRPMPCLKTLEYSQWTIVGPFDMNVSENNAPMLRDFMSTERARDPLQLILPWENLTRLRSTYEGTVDETLRLLKAIPNLESCWLVTSETNDESGNTDPIKDVFLPSMKALELHSTSTKQIGLVLDHLKLPELRTLRLYGRIIAGQYAPSSWGWPKEAVYRLAERQVVSPESKMKLNSLRLKGTLAFHFHEEDVLELIAHVPSLGLIDARDAMVRVNSREYVHFPEAQEATEDWHGVLVRI